MAPCRERSIRTFSGAHRLWLAPSPGFRPLPPSTTERRASCRKRRRAERGKTPRTSPSWQKGWYMSFRFFSFKHGKLNAMYKRKNLTEMKKKKKKIRKMPRRRSTSESGHRHQHHHHTHSVCFIIFCSPFLFIIAHLINRNGSFFFLFFHFHSYMFIWVEIEQVLRIHENVSFLISIPFAILAKTSWFSLSPSSYCILDSIRMNMIKEIVLGERHEG